MIMHYELTTVALVLHSYVLLVLAGVLMELALVAVVLAVAAAHRLLGFALAAQGAHAFSRQAVRRLDARAAVAAGHLGAGVLQGCGGRKRDKKKWVYWESKLVSLSSEYTCQPAPRQDSYCTPESPGDDRPPHLRGCRCTLGSLAHLLWA